MDSSANGSTTTLQLQERISPQTDNKVHPTVMGDGPMSDPGRSVTVCVGFVCLVLLGLILEIVF